MINNSTIYLCKSKNNHDVSFDAIGSHVATHFKDAPELRDIVTEIIKNTNLVGEKMDFDKDNGRVVGNMDVVDVDSSDTIIYAKRKNRDEYVPFVKFRTTQPTSLVSVCLVSRQDGYELTSAWFGELDSPPFPGEKSATWESVDFWNKHAFVWGSQGIQEDSQTSVCPW